MKELLFFGIGASVAGGIFVVALVELLFSRKRKKVEHEIKEQIDGLKESYSTTLGQVTTQDAEKLSAARKEVDAIKSSLGKEKEDLEAKYKAELDEALADSQKELESAKAKAKKLQEQAKLQADEYMASRTKEVEDELVGLVLDVTKRVLPGTLTYEIHKELVLQALRDVRGDHA